MMYHDLPSEEAEEWLAKLKPHSLATFQDKQGLQRGGRSRPHILSVKMIAQSLFKGKMQ
jgi:hypothetical protein